jgi:F-type H+-transporting ATPase subunit delta
MRRFATEASTHLSTSFTLPHQAIFSKVKMHQVNLSTTEGDLGILPNHVPTVLQLKPGKISFIDDKNTTWFASGGFALVHPDSSLNINAVEAYLLEDIDFDVP